MEEVELILFDLGGVLINIDYQATEKAFIAIGVTDFHEKYTQFQQNELFNQFETGQISAQHFINKLLPFTQKGSSPNEVVHAWNAMIGEFSQEKIDLLIRLSKEKRIALLSNTNELHMIQVMRAWENACAIPFESLFEQVFLSHEIHQRKPDVQTFEWVCNQLNISPSQVLFIDDNPQHIEGANAAGLKTHFYKDPKDFYALFS